MNRKYCQKWNSCLLTVTFVLLVKKKEFLCLKNAFNSLILFESIISCLFSCLQAFEKSFFFDTMHTLAVFSTLHWPMSYRKKKNKISVNVIKIKLNRERLKNNLTLVDYASRIIYRHILCMYVIYLNAL